MQRLTDFPIWAALTLCYKVFPSVLWFGNVRERIILLLSVADKTVVLKSFGTGLMLLQTTLLWMKKILTSVT